MDFLKLRPLVRNLALLAAVVLPATYPEASETTSYPYTGRITGSDTNLRAGSNLNYEIVTQVQKGDLVYVAGEWREWLKIRCPENTPLWISAQYIQNGVISANKLNIRSGPGLKYNVICQAVRDQEVTVLKHSEDRKWAGIQPPDDAYLWVHKDLVQKIGGPNLHAEFLSRQASLRQRLSKAEVVRELNMKKNPREVPFDEMIAEYENISGEYADFKEEAALASRRVEELKNMKANLDKIISTENKAREEEQKKVNFKPRFVTARGTISQAGGDAGKKGILKLTEDSKLVCVLTSDVIDLNLYANRNVQVWGNEQYDSSWDVPLINVTRVKRIR